jgi:uncharacterized coiled-coil DUF342 family protein
MRRSPKQALHTRYSPKMEIKQSASNMLMLPKQGIFGTLTKGISKVNKALDKAQEVHQQASEVYNKGQQLHQQARQVYSQIPKPYPQQQQVYSQIPQPYPQPYPQQQPQVYSQIPQPYPQPQSIRKRH